MGEMTLVERLRDTARRLEDTMGLTREGAIRRVHVLHDAVLDGCDRIEALEAENARLRAGMEAIKAVYDDQTVDIDDALSVAGKIATAALKDTRHA